MLWLIVAKAFWFNRNSPNTPTLKEMQSEQPYRRILLTASREIAQKRWLTIFEQVASLGDLYLKNFGSLNNSTTSSL